MQSKFLRCLGIAMMAAFALVPLTASAQFPGTNGRIYFISGPEPGGPFALDSMNPDGSQVKTVIADSGINSGFSISPDGTKIVGVNGSGVVTYNIDGTNMQQLTTDQVGSGFSITAADGHPVWSPDGTKIYFDFFDTNTKTNGGIFSINAGGSGKAQLVPNTSSITYSQPSVSPDNTKLAFQGTTSSLSDIFTSTISGGSLTNQTNVGSGTFYVAPDWSPDGTTLLFANDTPAHSIFTIPGGGGSVTTISVSGTNAITSAEWSPDGAKVLLSDSADLYTAKPDGSGLANLTTGTSFSSNVQAQRWSTVAVVSAAPTLPKTGGLNRQIPTALFIGGLTLIAGVEVGRRVLARR